MDAFNDKDKRKELFVEFVKSAEVVPALTIVMKRRHLKSRVGELKYKPMTEAELMAKFNDEDYVNKVLSECRKHKR